MKKRNSNLELLRIICIILIIAHHFALYVNWEKTPGITFNNIIINFLTIGGKIGVLGFILIAGYFGINSEFKVKKVIKLICQVVFYSILCLIIFNVFRFPEMSYDIKTIMKSLLPITYSQYWFITTYIILYILSPYINKLFKMLTKNELHKLLIILGVVCYIIPTFTTSNLKLSNLIIFIFIYIIGAYIKTYADDFKFKHKGLIYFVSIYFLILLSQIVFELIGDTFKISLITNNINYFIGENKLPILICAIILFISFKNLKIDSKYINLLASTSLGVYLIHENYFLRIFIWKILIDGPYLYNNRFLFIYTILIITVVYICSSIIELCRIYIIEKYAFPFIYRTYDNLSIKIQEKIKSKTNKIKE